MRDVPTSRLETPIADLRTAAAEHPFVLVVNGEGVVLGKVLDRSIDSAVDGELARDHLIEGPTTVRTSEDVEQLVERMRRADTGSVVVTTSEGRLVGVFFREDAAPAAGDSDGDVTPSG